MTSPTLRELELVQAFLKAKLAALEVQPVDDGGTANLDTAFLHVRLGLREPTVKRAAEAAGVSIGSRMRTRWWNGWFVHVEQGQGAMRTRMAEAAAKALNDAGESASVYYKID